MSYPFLWLLGISFVAAFAATPVARRVGAKVGLLDHPHARKLQKFAVPRTGGIGILVGLTAGTLLLLRISGALGVPITREILAIFVGAVVIHAIGLLDDLFDLPALLKLGAQALAVGVVMSQGVMIEELLLPGGATWEFGPLAAPLTAFFLLGFINAINLVDGLDGLASGIVAIGALALAVAGTIGGNYVLASMATILLGSVLGFLPYNFRREKTFLGDAGSMLLGYLLGVTAISGAWFSGTSVPVFIGLACAAVPILDTATTIVRRFRNGHRLFRPDAMHIHHRMIRFGLSPRRTVLTILAVTFFAAGQSIVFFVPGVRVLLVSTTAAALLAGLQILHRRNRTLAESDTGFRDILFYLLGAQKGSGPLMDETMGIADVIAAVETADGRRGAPPVPVRAPAVTTSPVTAPASNGRTAETVSAMERAGS